LQQSVIDSGSILPVRANAPGDVGTNQGRAGTVESRGRRIDQRCRRPSRTRAVVAASIPTALPFHETK
jgi:hypothetical protein